MNRIKELRKDKGISQAELAVALDTTQQAISLYECGKREPKLKTWQKLAGFFKEPISYVMGVDEYEKVGVVKNE